MARITATMNLSGGATGAQTLLDGKPPTTDGTGTYWSLDPGAHTYVVMTWGPPGAEVAFTVVNGAAPLTSGTLVVSSGHTNAVGNGPFSF